MKDRFSTKDPRIVGNSWGHYFKFVIILFVFWLLLTQTLHLKFIIMGIVSAFVVARVCMPLFLVFNHDRTKRYFMMDVNIFKFIGYCLWLLKELILANIDVIKAVWKKEMPIELQVLKFQCNYDNPVALSLLANSITLTPGTITLHVRKSNVYEIHALTPGAAQGIIDGSMLKKIAALYGESAEFEMLED